MDALSDACRICVPGDIGRPADHQKERGSPRLSQPMKSRMSHGPLLAAAALRRLGFGIRPPPSGACELQVGRVRLCSSACEQRRSVIPQVADLDRRRDRADFARGEAASQDCC